jgi:hypothetical protein
VSVTYELTIYRNRTLFLDFLGYRVVDARSVAADADASSTPSLRARVGSTGDASLAPRRAS